MPEVIAIAALGKKTKFICVEDKLLWYNPTDLKRVKELTFNHPIIMGRKTHDSIGKPLPERQNIILTRNESYDAPGCKIAHSKDEALDIARRSKGGDKIFIFGGAEIYKLFLEDTDKLMLTLVDSDEKGTDRFPDYEEEFVELEHHGSHEFKDNTFEWVDFVRKV